ncbi:hypothetical protein B0H12DRAFT_1238280 [Mycena haematopus]|nr:hypothetical protein B0H12DRAFT_1238280 [Mycena haematopus]
MAYSSGIRAAIMGFRIDTWLWTSSHSVAWCNFLVELQPSSFVLPRPPRRNPRIIVIASDSEEETALNRPCRTMSPGSMPLHSSPASTPPPTADGRLPGSSGYSHFLGFRIRSLNPVSSAFMQDELVEEIVRNVEIHPSLAQETEANLLLMSLVFKKASGELRRRRAEHEA